MRPLRGKQAFRVFTSPGGCFLIKNYTAEHAMLSRKDDTLTQAVWEPGGFAFLLLAGPTIGEVCVILSPYDQTHHSPVSALSASQTPSRQQTSRARSPDCPAFFCTNPSQPSLPTSAACHDRQDSAREFSRKNSPVFGSWLELMSRNTSEVVHAQK